MINPLIVFANAYDCEEAIQALKKLPYSQLHINYVSYPDNYTIAEKFFNENREFTHLFYVAPDIVVTNSGFKIMIEYIENNDPPVYGCCCNVDTDKLKDVLACTLKLPDLKYENRRYRWIQESHRQIFLDDDIPIIKVGFNANLCFVRRDIKEKIKYMAIPYQTDERPIHEREGGYACDLAFNHYCEFLHIDRLVDLRVKFNHLRYAGPLQVGKKDPLVIFKNYYNNSYHDTEIKI